MLDRMAYAYGVRSRTKSILGFRGLVNTSSLPKIVLRVIVCCLRGVCFMSSRRRIPHVIVLFYSGHRWLFFVASLWAYVVVASFLCLRVVGSSFRRLRYILRQVPDVWGNILYQLNLHNLYLPSFAWCLIALLPCYLVTL